jgi:hypothetical protein
LYWYRTPPDVKVGREPFDPAVRAALEANNPGVRFDWRQILETPIPSADAEKWRERRRAERSERAARQALDQEDDNTAAAPAAPEAPKHVIEAATAGPEIVASVDTSAPPPILEVPAVAAESAAAAPPAEAPSGLSRRKRRRRRGRGRETTRAADAGTPAAAATPEIAADTAPGDEHATDSDE